jgi:hypothetical protein
MNKIVKFICNAALILIYGFVVFVVVLVLTDKQKEPTEKLYFEFHKKDSSVTADGFLRYKGKWCPIVLNDSMAVIYQ